MAWSTYCSKDSMDIKCDGYNLKVSQLYKIMGEREG
jgi:hypothetical protein